jgi:hypothetical protein
MSPPSDGEEQRWRSGAYKGWCGAYREQAGIIAGSQTALKISFNRPDLDLTLPGCHGL